MKIPQRKSIVYKIIFTTDDKYYFHSFSVFEKIIIHNKKTDNMKKTSILSAMALIAILLGSCSKTCVCTSRSQNTDGSIWEWETSFEVVGGTSCVENAEDRDRQILVDNEGNEYLSYECREE